MRRNANVSELPKGSCGSPSESRILTTSLPIWIKHWKRFDFKVTIWRVLNLYSSLFLIHALLMIVELYAKSDVGRVRRGNEDNFLVLDLTTEQTWSGSDGATPPEKLTRFTLGDRGLVLVCFCGMDC